MWPNADLVTFNALTYLIFPDRRILCYPDIIVRIKLKQWPTFTSSFSHDEIVKCVVLKLIVWHGKTAQNAKFSMKDFLVYKNQFEDSYSVGIYLLKVNNRKTRTRCEICSKLTIKNM